MIDYGPGFAEGNAKASATDIHGSTLTQNALFG